MTVAAFIAEFNPPHQGHAYLVENIRRELGNDTVVIAIMSGNYVQRGSLAICDKYARARMALSIGVNLVLELPFPYSLSTAQRYAAAGVSIANALGCVNYLCFGSECGDIHELARIADKMNTPSFDNDINKMRHENGNRKYSYAEIRTTVLAKHIGEDAANLIKKPNNLLAISYLQALCKLNSAIVPLTYPRMGGYHDTQPQSGHYASASHLRSLLNEEQYDEVKKHLPDSVYNLIKSEIMHGRCPAQIDKLSTAILTGITAHCCQGAPEIFAECDLSLTHRLYDALQNATNLNELITLTKARHYTEAHIRRAILFSYFGVTSSEIETSPAYTRLLAADSIGCRQLKIIKRTGSIPILTKPADYHLRLEKDVSKRAEFDAFADSVYFQSLPKPQSAAEVFRKTPFVGN